MIQYNNLVENSDINMTDTHMTWEAAKSSDIHEENGQEKDQGKATDSITYNIADMIKDYQEEYKIAQQNPESWMEHWK